MEGASQTRTRGEAFTQSARVEMEPTVNQKPSNRYPLPAVPHASNYWSEFHGREKKKV